MHRYQYKAKRIVNNQGNMTAPKETNKTPGTDPKEMKTCELSEKEFRIISIPKEIQWATRKHRQLNEIRKIMHEKFSKEKRF